MWLIVLLLFQLSLLGFSSGDDTCTVDGKSRIALKINDTDSNKNLFTGTYTGTKPDCTSKSDYDYSNMFEFSANGTHFLIDSTPRLVDVDQITPKTLNLYTIAEFQCRLCPKKPDLTVSISVYDTNNHAPQFSEKEYSYEVAAPIMPLTDFTIYGEQIIVEDIDFTNQNVTYSIDPEDFTISTISEDKQKQYTAVFKANKLMKLDNPLTYKITATDSGSKPGTLSNSTTITIQAKPSLSFDTPSFEKLSYSFNYSSDGKTATLTPRDGSIILSTLKPELVEENINLGGEFSENFNAKFYPTNNTIVLDTAPLPTTSLTDIILTLSVKTDAVAMTSIHIYLSTPKGAAPTFSSPIYKGRYDDVENVVEIDPKIQIFSTGTPTVKLSGDHDTNFLISYNDKKNTWDLTVKTKLLPKDFKSPYLSLKLTATLDDASAESALIIDLPQHLLQFTEALYSATYNTADNSVTVDEKEPIAFSSADGNVEVTATGENSDSFTITYDEKDKKCEVKTNGPLPSDVLSSGAAIILTLTAKDSYNNLASAVLSIQVPKSGGESPKFSSASYSAMYPESGSGTIDFQPSIEFSNVKDLSKVTLNVKDYQENFDVVFENQKWRLKIKKPLKDSLSDIVTFLTAKEDGNTLEGSSLLVLEMPKSDGDDKTPKFSETFYTSDYPKDGKGTLKLQSPLSFKNVEKPTDVNISLSDYSKNFAVEYDPTSKSWQVKVNAPLDEAVLKTETVLTITLIATEKGVDGDGRSVLVIYLPKLEPEVGPTFSKPHYAATYEYDSSGSPVVVLTDAIEITNIDNFDEISIVADDYTDSFNISYDVTKKSWLVTVEQSLPDTIFDNKTSHLIIVITATDNKNGLTSQSIIDLNLPTVNTKGAPIFSKTSYTAQYTISNGKGFVTLEEPLALTNRDTFDTISIVTDNYKDNFEITYNKDTKKWTIGVKKALDQSVLNAKFDLVLGLTATDSDLPKQIGKSVLILKLPIVNNEEAPKFSSIFYECTYASSTSQLDASIQIINKKDLDKINVNVDDTYKSYFDVSLNTEKSLWSITVKKLPEEIINSGNDLVVTLTATEKDNNAIGQAALVLKFPPAPYFSKAQYFGNYTVEKDSSKLTVEDIIVKTRGEKAVGEVKISLMEDADIDTTKYFSLEPVSGHYEVKLSNPLPATILDNKDKLVLTLEADLGTIKSYATLIIDLPSQQNEDISAVFSQVLYDGRYEINKGKVNFTVDDIKVVTKSADENVAVTMNGSYSSYFKLSYVDKKVTIELEKELPDEILSTVTVISLTLTVQVKGTIQSSSAVVNIEIANDKNEDTAAVSFTSFVFDGQYKVEDGKVTVTHNPITVETKEDDDKIDIRIENEYASYFSIDYAKKQVIVSSKTADASATLAALKNILLEMTIRIKNTTSSSSAVLNLEVLTNDKNNNQSTISFSEGLYSAKYYLKDEKPIFKMDKDIGVITDVLDSDIEITASNDYGYDKYFTLTYSNHKVLIGLAQNIPEDVLENNSFILIILKATIKESGKSGITVLNIEIDYDHNKDDNDDNVNTTGYVAAIVVLSLLIVGLIAVAGAFYYFKLRNKSYDRMDDEEEYGKVRFDKQSQRPSKSKRSSTIEERRPTGFIFRPMDEDAVEKSESTPNNGSENAPERRKSVAFNENVEKLELDHVINDEDIDRALDEDKKQVTPL